MPSLKPLIAAWVALVLLLVLVSTALHAQAAFPAYTVGQGGTGSTTLTGILKGNGASTVGTAVAGTDYQAPVSATSPITILSNVIACLAANGSQTGCLSSADWSSFNSRLSTTSLGLFDKGFFFSTTSADVWGALKAYLTGVTASAPLSGAGTSGSPLVISQANGSTNGYLSSTDFSSFNNRLSTTSLGLIDKGFFFSTTSADAYEATQAPRGTATTSFKATFPITLTTAASGITYGWGGLSTSSALSAGASVLYATGANTVASAATGTITCTGTVSCGSGSYIIGPNLTISGAAAASTTLFSDTNTWGGVNTFSTLPKLGTLSGLISGNSGSLYAAATGTVAGSGLVSVTAGQSVIGTGLTVSLSNIAANTVIGNPAGASAAPMAFATSSLFAAGTPGQVLGYTNGAWAPMATATCAQITGGAGLCDGTDATASSTLLSDANTWLGIQNFRSPTTMATATIAVLNGMFVVDGVYYAKTSTGIQQALNDVYAASGGGTVYLPAGVYDITEDIGISTSTTLLGAGASSTILRINPASIGNVIFYILQAKGTSKYVTVAHLQLDGNYDNLVAPPANRGGLLSPDDYWTVEDVIFNSSNLFMIFPNNTDHMTIRKAIFMGNGAGSDCIGGGGNTNHLVEDVYFAPEIECNMFDQVRGSNITIRDFRSDAPHSVYFEGITDSMIDNMRLYANGNIVLETEGGYTDKTYITNPKNITVQNSYLLGGGYINIAMRDETGHASALSHTKGGNIRLIGNHVENAIRSGMFWSMSTSSLDIGGNVVADNTFVGGNTNGAATWNVGNGIMNTSAINIMKGSGFSVTGNSCTATTTPTIVYCIDIGDTFAQTSAEKAPHNVHLSGNSCAANSTLSGCEHVVTPRLSTDVTQYGVDNLYWAPVHRPWALVPRRRGHYCRSPQTPAPSRPCCLLSARQPPRRPAPYSQLIIRASRQRQNCTVRGSQAATEPQTRWDGAMAYSAATRLRAALRSPSPQPRSAQRQQTPPQPSLASHRGSTRSRPRQSATAPELAV
jgi:hypothetical protein